MPKILKIDAKKTQQYPESRVLSTLTIRPGGIYPIYNGLHGGGGGGGGGGEAFHKRGTFFRL